MGTHETPPAAVRTQAWRYAKILRHGIVIVKSWIAELTILYNFSRRRGTMSMGEFGVWVTGADGSVLALRRAEFLAKLQRHGIRRIQLQGGVDCLPRFWELGLHAKRGRQANPGVHVTGRGAHRLPEVLLRGSRVPAARS